MTIKKAKLKKEEKRKSRLRGKLDPLLGLPAEQDPDPESVNGDDLNLLKDTRSPSSAWANVDKESIGEGFQAVDDSIFDIPRDAAEELFLKPFKNRFIHGKSPIITYTANVKLRSKKKQPKKREAFNENTRVTKEERKKFSEKLGSNIDKWRELFVHDLLPMTLSIQTASEEVKEKMAQLVDDTTIGLPTDYIKAKTLQALQLRVVRAISEALGLTPDEQKSLLPELLSPKSTK